MSWLPAALSTAAAAAFLLDLAAASWLVPALLITSVGISIALAMLVRATRAPGAAGTDSSVSAREERLAVVTHDLRAPLAGIIGLCDVLLDSALDRAQREISTRIQGSARDLIRLSDDVLDLTRLETGRLHLDPAPFAVRSLLRESLETVRGKEDEKRVSLSLEVSDALPERLIGDAFRIRQILVNLLTNAIKFTENGSVSVHADWTFADDRDLLSVEVRDTGIGIPRARQAAIFERYAQAERSTQRRFGGTGLGLSICAELCALMRGEMKVRSKEGKGSVFRLELPLPKLWEDDETWISRAQRAVLVDPCPLGRRHLVDALALLGVETIERPTLRSALQFLHEGMVLGQVPELVIVHRSVLRGYEEPTAEAIATEPALRQVMRLIVRGRDDDDALPPGFSAAIRRPVDLAALKSAVGIAGPIHSSIARRRRAPRPATPPATPPAPPAATHAHVVPARDPGRVIPGAKPLPPATKPTPAREATPTREATPATRVLAADDDPVQQTVLRHMLRRCGADATIVSSGEDAVARFAADRFDVVILDARMPGLDGFETATRLRSLHSRRALHSAARPLIALLTANPPDSVRDQAVISGVDVVLQKPLNYQALSELLARDARPTATATATESP